MSVNVEQAAKGRKSSMLALYQANRNAVYLFCKLLLEEDAPAGTATAAAFQEAWQELAARGTGTEVSFRHDLMLLAAKLCWKQLSAAMPPPSSAPKPTSARCRKVSGKRYDGPVDEGMELLQGALSQMEPLPRFVYLSIIAGSLSTKELGRITGQSDAVVKAIYNNSIAALSCYLPPEGDLGLSYQQIKSLLQKAAGEQPFPPETDQVCLDQIKARAKVQLPSSPVLLLAGCVLVCGVILTAYLMESQSSSNIPNREKQVPGSSETTVGESQTAEALRTDADYFADIVIEDYGTITVELDQDAAPITTANFVSLANDGFYDGLTFHRIIDGFMMQGGDPNGDGTGGSGTTIVGEFTNNGYDNTLSHTRGAISMARSSDYDSASSQFFIVQEDASASLDGDYAVFGYVTEGMDIVDAICEDANPTDDNGTISPDEQPVITTITIREEDR